VLEARVFAEEPVGLTELQHEALTTLDGTETVAALAARLGGAGDVADAQRQVLRLAQLGAVDLVDAPLSRPLTGRFQERRVSP
jgi:hypothetical protein